MQDVVAGLHSLAEAGRFDYKIRPAVRQAMEARIADAKPVANKHDKKTGGLLGWIKKVMKPS